MSSSFDVGFLMGAVAGLGVAYVFGVVRAWWRSIHPKRVDWDPTVERIRRL